MAPPRLAPVLLALAVACSGGAGREGVPGGNGDPERWQPTSAAPIHWHWQLSGDFDPVRDLPLLQHRTVFDLDGELTPASTVALLHALGPGVRVVCYIDVGAYESYRSDHAMFPPEVIEKANPDWDGTFWLDIRRQDVLLPIMRHRMSDWCLAKGFDAVEPDESEVFGNDPGYDLTQAQNDAYNTAIAGLAHELGLSVGLKGNNARAAVLEPYFDWALSEQCWQYGECQGLRDSFAARNKAVFDVEYDVDPDCARSRTWHLNAVRRDLDLVGPAEPTYLYRSCVPDDQDGW